MHARVLTKCVDRDAGTDLATWAPCRLCSRADGSIDPSNPLLPTARSTYTRGSLFIIRVIGIAHVAEDPAVEELRRSRGVLRGVRPVRLHRASKFEGPPKYKVYLMYSNIEGFDFVNLHPNP